MMDGPPDLAISGQSTSHVVLNHMRVGVVSDVVKKASKKQAVDVTLSESGFELFIVDQTVQCVDRSFEDTE